MPKDPAKLLRFSKNTGFRLLSFVICSGFAALSVYADRPDHYVFTGENGSIWNTTDLNWNGDEAWVNDPANAGNVQFSGISFGQTIRLDQNISTTYLHFKGVEAFGNGQEYILNGNGNYLHAYQIVFTSFGLGSEAPAPQATFRDTHVVLSGGSVGTYVDREPESDWYDFSDRLAGQAQQSGTLNFRGTSSLIAHVGIHSSSYELNAWASDGDQMFGISAGTLPEGAVINFYDTSTFNPLGIKGGTLNFYNNSSMVVSFDRYAVFDGKRVFRDQSVLDIQQTTWLHLPMQSEQGGIFRGEHEFRNSSVMNARVTKSVNGLNPSIAPHFEFYNGSTLNVLADIALDGGFYYFYDYSTMEISDGSVANGYFYFEDSSILNVRAGGRAVHDPANLSDSVDPSYVFRDDSTMNLLAAGGLSFPGRFTFSDRSVLNANVADAIGDTTLTFEDDSVLNANARHAIRAPKDTPEGILTFRGNSVLNALNTESVSGGRQQFHNNSTLNALSMFALQEVNQEFHDDSTLNAEVTASVNASLLAFSGRSTLNALDEMAVAGSTLTFSDESSLRILADTGVFESTGTFTGESSLEANVTGALRDADTTLFFWENSALNVNEAGAIFGGIQEFFDSARLNVQENRGIAGGEQRFWDTSILDISASDGLTAGTQIFHDNSELFVSFNWAIQQGTQNFYHTSKLSANFSNAIEGGTQNFYGESSLHLVEKAIGNGTQNFNGDSILHATHRQSIFGGEQNFDGNSKLLASNTEAIDGGLQRFYGSSTLLASEAEAIASGLQQFFDNSQLNAYHADAIAGGTQVFYGNSQLNARAHSTRSANELTFFGNSALNAQASQAIINGSQVFSDSSSLNITAGYGVIGGRQTFYKTSVLNANAANALNDGLQTFYEGSTLNVNAAGAISGSRIYLGELEDDETPLRLVFLESSVLNFNAANGNPDRVLIGLRDNSTLNAKAANSITGATDLPYPDINLLYSNEISMGDASTLNLAAAYAMSGGIVVAQHEAVINMTAANGFSGGFIFLIPSLASINTTADSGIGGGHIRLEGETQLNVRAAAGIAGGFQTFYDESSLQIHHANAISGGIQRFWEESTLNVRVANGLGGGTQEFLQNAVLNAGVADSISGGTQRFYGESVLQAGAARSVKGGEQTFTGNSVLNTTGRSAISGGIQRFYDQSVLNASEDDVLSGGVQHFYDSSRLHADSAWAIARGEQNFYDTAMLHATEIFIVHGATSVQNFYDNSSFQIDATQVIRSGTQNFYDSSQLNIGIAINEAITGGTQNFYDSSRFHAASRAITGGTQNFHDSSRLITGGGTMINGGAQNFYDNSVLEAIGQVAIRALNNGTQTFRDNSQLILGRANALTGGVQIFRDKSVLHASEAGAVAGGDIRLNDQARLEINVANALGTSAAVSFHEASANTPGGIMRLNGHNVTVGILRSAVAGSGLIENDHAQSATLTVSFNTPSDNLAREFSGLIRDGEADAAALSLIKAGTGSWILRGENTWTGGSEIQNGRLVAAHDYALGTGDVTVGIQGTLAALGKREIGNDIINRGMIAGDSTGELLSLTGNVTGTGAFSGNIISLGSFHSGNTSALIQAAGDLAFGANHRLVLDIGGTERGTGHDAFNVSGTLGLGGLLQITLQDSYMPLLPESFTLFSGSGLTGSFASYDFSQAILSNSKLAWDVAELASSGKLHAIANPFYGQENPDGTLNMIRIGENQWVADVASNYTGMVLVEENAVQIAHDQALGSGEVSIAEDGRIESDDSRILSNDIVNQGVVAGPDSEGDEWMRLEGDVSGAGSYEGNIEFAGSFSPGNSPALILADGNLSFAEMHTLIMEIGGLVRGEEYDAFNITGVLTLGGNLTVSLISDFTPQAGQSFQIFNAGQLTGSFATTSFDFAVLGEGLYWDTSSLGTDGILSVAVVPEPSVYMLFVIGIGMFLVFRKYRRKICLS